MKCPVCETEVLDGIQYCPVCGSDIAMALERTQAMPRAQVTYGNTAQTYNSTSQSSYSEPISQVNVRTQPAQINDRDYYESQPRPQRYEQPVQNAQPQQHRAVPLNGTPAVSYAQGKTIDTRQISSSPKWPIVLIVLLVLLIIALVLLIFHPWNPNGSPFVFTTDQQSQQVQQTQSGAPGQDQVQPVEQTAVLPQDQTGIVETTPADGSATQVGETAVTGSEGAAPASDSAAKTAAAVETITNAYNQLAVYDDLISNNIAANFNSNYTNSNTAVRQQYAHETEQTLIELKTLLSQVTSVDTSTAPGLETPKQTVASMLDCLVKRTELISEAWNLLASVDDPNTVAGDAVAIVGRDNEGGTNRYKTQYINTYESFNLSAALAEAGV